LRLWLRKRSEQDLERELRTHLELEAEEQQDCGVPSREAIYAARRAFGNTTLVKEAVREMWGWASVERLCQDLRYALRLWGRAPGFAAIVVLTLALGIGADTAVFSVFNSVLLQPLPYRNSDRLFAIWYREIHAKGTSKLFDLYSDYENWKANARTIEALAAVSWAPQASPERIFTGHGPTRVVFALPVTADFFSLLGVPAMVGRTFDESDRAQGCVVVLAHSFWQTVLGGQKSVVGQTIRLGDEACSVLGVMPPDFAFLPPEASVAMWTIMAEPSRPNEFAVGVFAKLRPGASLDQARAEISLLHHQIHQHDRGASQMQPVMYELHGEFTWLTGRNLRLSLVVLLGAVSFVLLICCANVANLLLGRVVGRQREMSTRAALGAGYGRLMRQLLTENLLSSLVASIAGAGLATAAVRFFRSARPIEMPPAARIELSTPVLLFAVLLSIMTALIFGLVPAWRASRTDSLDVLKTSVATSRGHRQQRLVKGLIVIEVMLTVVLVAGAGMLIQTLQRFASTPLGFSPDGLLTTALRLPPHKYKDPQTKIQLFERLRTKLSEIPEIQGVAFSSARPVQGGGSTVALEVEGYPEPRLETGFDTSQQTVSPEYFQVMNIPINAGRSFRAGDQERTQAVAIVNEVAVRKYFANEDPIGKHVRPFTGSYRVNPWLTVVGVVGNEKRTTVYQEMAWTDRPILYRPFGQNPMSSLNIIMRTVGPASGILGDRIQQNIAKLDSDIPVEEIRTASDLESKVLAYPRFRAEMLGVFAGLALVLATVGLFGVVSRLVAQRTHEIGIRMALGAQKRTVLILIMGEGLLLTTAGMILGIAMALLLGRYLGALLYGVQPADPRLFAATALVLVPAALTAIYLPARRAASVDPVVALRYE
jgi:predicted permease